MAVFFFTLGCKLNRLETEALAAAFRDAGFPVFHGTAAPPDGLTAPEGTADGLTAAGGAPELAVINTCTVTSKAEQKARRIIRFCLRRFRAVLVTGCYAELEAASLAALGSENPGGGPLLVVPGSRKDRLLDLPRYLADRGVSALAYWDAAGPPAESLPAESPPGPAGGPRAGPFRFTPERIFHSRPFLKIQDGCDRRCAYCRVPLARGRSVSLDRGEILRRLEALERAGLAEAVITGVNICQYRD
ncbi:MAG: tRNA (N(6)-L-threonylcarbamoyladenosine(37)-C(2))-methylthiotransferase MtaB, partial [Treponema sp.]|nr:tRNA (N(6)-L-threonylcarbamoyladenosine(37)-C(2))-methylthiotransferase MtaB [Treponema sp.]